MQATSIKDTITASLFFPDPVNLGTKGSYIAIFLFVYFTRVV